MASACAKVPLSSLLPLSMSHLLTLSFLPFSWTFRLSALLSLVSISTSPGLKNGAGRLLIICTGSRIIIGFCGKKGVCMQRHTPNRQFQPGFPRAIKYGQNAGSFDTLPPTPAIEEHTTLLPAPAAPGSSIYPPTLTPLVQPLTSLRPLIPPNSSRQFPSHTIHAKPYLPTRRRRKRRYALLILLLLTSVLLLFLASFWLSSRASADVTLFQAQMQRTEHIVGGGGVLYPRQQLN